MNDLRVAWLLPVTWFYWHPMLSEFSSIFPKTKVFTALFPGYSQGYEDGFQINTIGKFKVLRRQKRIFKHKAPIGFTSISPSIVADLFQFRPNLIITSSFGIWTIIALMFKQIGRWKVIVAYEGSSPRVDFLYSPVRILIRQLMVKQTDAFITNTNRGKAYLTNTLRAEPERVFARPYEIPSIAPASSLENKLGDLLTDNKPLFLFVGRLMPRKGLDLLLQACSILKQQGYDNYTLEVIGDGEQRQELETFCQNQGLEKLVKWIGKVDYQEINAYFQAADVFVFPTLEDTWGIVTLETMLMGKPILCSSGAGSSELVINGKNGYVFDPRQPEKLAQLMQKFINEPNLAQKMGEQSKQIIANNTPKKAANFIAEVIKFVERAKQ